MIMPLKKGLKNEKKTNKQTNKTKKNLFMIDE